jgi:DegV family protein with EDD domain
MDGVMSPIAFVTDSSANIPAELTRGLNIHYVPLIIEWDGQTFRDGLDIQPDEFYRRLKSNHSNPTTSAATPDAFLQVFQPLLAEGYDILCITLTGALSRLNESAVHAARQCPAGRVTVVDSRSVSMGMGFYVLAAARAAAAGASLTECINLIEKLKPSHGLFLLPATLEYLHRGGRVGIATTLLGTALSIKPLLEVRDGMVHTVARVRTFQKALQTLITTAVERIGRAPLRLATGFAGDNEADAHALLQKVESRLSPGQVVEKMVIHVTPVVGVHIGPGGLGLAFVSA